MTEKWEDTWFFSLKPKYKLFWLFILDRCDHAGIWEANLPLASTYLGATYTEEECLEVLGNKVQKINGSKWLIRRFIFHQYGCDASELNESNPAHKGVLTALKRHGIGASMLLQSPIDGAMDKDKDKEKDKDKVKIKEEKKKFAEFVSLTESEHTALVGEIGEVATKQAIEILDNYKGSKGKKYVSDYRAIRSWVIGELEKRRSSGGSGARGKRETFTSDTIERIVRSPAASS